jgi:hypothetical protein
MLSRVLLLAFCLACAQAQTVTFYRDVLPILQDHCQSCHRAGEIGPMQLVTYRDARPWSRQIAQRTTTKDMPPWFADPRYGHFSNDPSLIPSQIATLAAWARAGAPAGNPRDAPPPRQWAAGWLIPTPDAFVKMPTPVAIPARGIIDYTYEIVPTSFTEDKWVRMSEVRPERRGNIHHAVVYIRPPGSNWLQHAPIGQPFTANTLSDPQDRRDAMSTKSDMLLVYAPGSSPDQWPEGMAKLVPCGSDLVFQMHYTANGQAGTDQTGIGMVFAKEPPRKRVLTLQLTNDRFVIPPGDPDYHVEAHGSLPNDALLLSFFPHLHLRGKEFSYNIVHPEKSGPERLETLLRVHYNFYWQLSYRLAEPLPLKAGTILQAAAVYDNSHQNPHNPDPDAAVTWGDQTSDEMMVGFFDIAVDPSIDKPQFFIRDGNR